MQAVTARAKFIEPAAGSATPGLTTAIPRSEIERVVGSGEDPELRLEVMRIQGDGGPRREKREVTVAWDREDLERLLRTSVGRYVTLSIDPESLVQALDEPDVEAHGLRETLVVLSVAAATAVGAGAAAAAPMADAGGGGGASTGGVPAAYTAVETSRADLLSQSSEEASGGVPAAYTDVETSRADLLAASSQEAESSVPTAYTDIESARADLLAAASQEGGTLPAALTAVETARAELLAASSQEADTLPAALTAVETARAELLAASSQQAETLPAALTALETARAELLAATNSSSPSTDVLPAALTAVETARAELMAAQSSAPTTIPDDGPTFSAPSPEQIGFGAAAIALAITGAAFAARGRRGPTPA